MRQYQYHATWQSIGRPGQDIDRRLTGAGPEDKQRDRTRMEYDNCAEREGVDWLRAVWHGARLLL